MIHYIVQNNVESLPEAWDELAKNYFQRREFLCHASKYNPCYQRYYLCFDQEVLIAAAIVYTLQLDLLTFLHIKSPLKMNIVGVPCSVSASGIFGNHQAMESLKGHIFKVEKGLVLFLNLEQEPAKGNYAFGKTLPTIAWSNSCETWDNYFIKLRSAYRRRLKILLKPMSGLQFEYIPLSKFTPEHYQMYLEVLKRSKGKLEQLTIEFFKNLPPDFEMMVCTLNGKTIGWNIALMDGQTCFFFLGGIDYSYNKAVNTYLRLMAMLVKNGIVNKASYIDLGQTAETPKMRMGGKPVTLFMQARHSNYFFNSLIKHCSFLLEYKMRANYANPLKDLDK